MKPVNFDDNATWKQRFRAPRIPLSQVASLNPAHGAIVTNRDGIYQVYAWDVFGGELRQITTLPTGTRNGFIGADGRYIYYHHDQMGNELGHYVRVPFEGGETEDLTPDLPDYASFSFAESRDGRVQGFVVARGQGFEILGLNDGERKLLFSSKSSSVGPFLSYGGEIAVVATTERTGQNAFSLVAIETTTGQRFGELFDQDSSIEPTSFSPIPNDWRMLAASDKSGYKRPLLWNPRNGERQDFPLPTLDGEIYPLDWSPDAQEILFYQLHQAQFQLCRYRIASGVLTKLDHPSGTFSTAYYLPTGEIFANFSSGAQPPSLIALDGQSGKQTQVVLKAGDVPVGRPWQSVTFPSTDNMPIQAWLTVPEGSGPFPTILMTHGGPTSFQSDSFDAYAQALVDHDCAVLSINYRGSVTFGKAFERAIWEQLGSVEVDDMAAAHDWLIANNIAQPHAIFPSGGSYGGFLTLQALGKKPDLWAGGMAMVAIADWSLLYEDEAETLRGYQRSLFGGTPAEKPEAHRASSPITYAADIRAPILVIQGSNDTRCPPRQMRVYEDKLKSLGKSIEVHWFDAGHGSLAVEQSIEHMTIILDFIHQVLSDRPASS